jgi:hypothetical protein
MINGNAFDGCIALSSVTIGNGVNMIGEYAFYGCSSLVNVNIPESVTGIGMEAFGGCSSLTAIRIPTSIMHIPERMFAACYSLRSVTIPAQVTSVGYDAFYDCYELMDVYYGGTRQRWDMISIDVGNEPLYRAGIHCNTEEVYAAGLYFAFNDDGTCFVSGIGSCTDTIVFIPKEYEGMPVTGIGPGAFAECYPLQAVVIPDSVTYISENAFGNCHNLVHVVIPGSVASIGDGAFSNCHMLSTVDMGDGVSFIGNNAFISCYSLAGIDLPDSVTYIGVCAFAYNASLTGIKIPAGVSEIGEHAFEGCGNLTSINLHIDVQTIGWGAFFECYSLNDVYYDGTESRWNLITIHTENDPIHFAKIHYSGYEKYSEGLDFLMIDDWTCYVSGIGYCTDEIIVIPREYMGMIVAGIDENAFSNCNNVRCIVIPDSVTTIKSYAFYGCECLQTIEIPESVVSIGYGAFYGCYTLTDVYYGGTRQRWGTLYIDVDNEPLFRANVHYSNDEKYSDGLDFYDKGDGTCYVSSIGSCMDSSIFIPEEYSGMIVNGIGANAFSYCSHILAIAIPDSITFIESDAFNNCQELNAITFEGTVEQWRAITKASYWNYNVPATEVICSDGVVSLS